MELIDTSKLMISKNYQDRFKAEYYQTKIRYEKLHSLIIKYDAGVLGFKLNCPIELLKKQCSIMEEYLYRLEMRAEIENIVL
jgi:hypothetical protein